MASLVERRGEGFDRRVTPILATQRGRRISSLETSRGYENYQPPAHAFRRPDRTNQGADIELDGPVPPVAV